jgi:hypothetical protein
MVTRVSFLTWMLQSLHRDTVLTIETLKCTSNTQMRPCIIVPLERQEATKVVVQALQYFSQ